MRADTIEAQLAKRIRRTKRTVFLRADLADLGKYDRIGRALGRLVKQGVVIRIGQGVYARAVPSPVDTTPVPTKGVSELMTEALARLGIQARPTRLQTEYNAGRTTQVPTGRVIGVDRRVRRKLGYNGCKFRFERG
jgi:hypothetical protein